MAGQSQSTLQKLSVKDREQFNKIMTHYEQTQHTEGLALCEDLLARHPKQSETLSMKALFLIELGRKKEAEASATLGLSYSKTSQMSWHVMGIVQRSNKNYKAVVECYQNVMKLDPENQQIKRELPTLQTHSRDWQGLKTSRMHLLKQSPEDVSAWIGMAIAYHKNKLYPLALGVLQKLETQHLHRDEKKVSSYMISEVYAYHAQILVEANQFAEVLSFLEIHKDHILDFAMCKETKAVALLKVGNFQEARIEINALVSLNPDCKAYYDLLDQVMAASGDVDLLTCYRNLKDKFPYSFYPKIKYFSHLDGQESCEAELRDFVTVHLNKGTPTLFAIVKSLYTSQSLSLCFESIMLDLLEQEHCQYGLSIRHFLAQHYLHLGKLHECIQYADACVKDSPDFLDSYLTKASALKKLGATHQAADLLEKAREKDPSDRFMNTKASKYLLRAGDLARFEKTVMLFAVDPTPPAKSASEECAPKSIQSNGHNLSEMQCMWYQLYAAKHYLQNRFFGHAMEHLNQIATHFQDIDDDLYDFHPYCLHKGAIRAYVAQLDSMAVLKRHPYFVKAAHLAIQALNEAFDLNLIGLAPTVVINAMLTKPEPPQPSKKSTKNKKKKDTPSAKNTVSHSAAENSVASASDGGIAASLAALTLNEPYQASSETDTKKLRSLQGYEKQAKMFLEPLLSLTPESIDTLLLAADVCIRIKDWIKAQEHLLKAHTLSSSIVTQRIYSRLIHLVHACNDQSVIIEAAKLLGINAAASSDQSMSSRLLAMINSDFAKNFDLSYPLDRLCYAKTLMFLLSKDASELTEKTSTLLLSEFSMYSASLQWKSASRILHHLEVYLPDLKPQYVEKLKECANMIVETL